MSRSARHDRAQARRSAVARDLATAGEHWLRRHEREQERRDDERAGQIEASAEASPDTERAP
jgi:hypothetical protein